MSYFATQRGFWLCFTLALLSYTLPWVVNPSSGLTMSAYDFAEWLSKSTFQTVEVTVLLLRGQLFLFTVLLVTRMTRPLFTLDWWFKLIFAGLLIIAQLPALNILPNLGNDPNRQQQVILATLSIFSSLLGASGILWRFRSGISVIVVVVAIGSSLYGQLEAIHIMQAYGLAANFGIGLIGYLFFCLLLGLFTVWEYIMTTRNKTGLPQ